MSMQRLMVLLLMVSSWLWAGVQAYSSGAPSDQCGPMMPDHGTAEQTGDGPFVVTTTVTRAYVLGQTYSVTVRSTDGTEMRGLLCQVRDASVARGVAARAEGDFTTISKLRNLDCTGQNGVTSNMSAITHSERINQNTITFDWTAPAVRGAGSLKVVCTVVQSRVNPATIHYNHIPSAIFNAPAVPVNSTTVPVPTTTPSPTMSAMASIDLNILAGCRGSSPTKFCFTRPSGCNTSCSYIYTHRLVGNGSDIEVELFGTAGSGSGWLAVAYSSDSEMGDDDVLACDIDNNGFINAKNLNNVDRTNRRDSGASSFLTVLETARTSNQIYCRFSRPLVTGGLTSQDFDLSQSWTYFFGSHSSRRVSATSALGGQHAVIPLISDTTYSAASTGFAAASAPNREAIKAHGILMVLAWVAASSVGMFLARHMKKAWVSKPYWFLFHRGIMVSVWIVTLVAFILIFVDVGGYTEVAKTHAALGIIVVVLAFVQPFMALLRCGPTEDKRVIFNWAHRLVGATAQILAVATIYLGLAGYEDLNFDINGSAKDVWITWVAISGTIWVSFEIYNIIFKPEVPSTPSKDIAMKEKGAVGDDDDQKPPPAQPISDQNGRIFIFALYVLVSVVHAITLCVFIGIADNDGE